MIKSIKRRKYFELQIKPEYCKFNEEAKYEQPTGKKFFFTLLEKVKKKLGIIKKTLEDLEKMKKYNEKFPLFSSDIQSAQLFTSNSKQLQVFYNKDGMVKLVSY